MAAKEFIVAIELGSSKVTGIAGQKNLDGSIQILAMVKEDSSAFIRKASPASSKSWKPNSRQKSDRCMWGSVDNPSAASGT